MYIALIKQCSRRYLSDFAHKIVSKGKKPEYLDLFVGMTELSEVMGSHVLVVETEISTYLTAREWKKHILLWCAPPDSDEYVERRKVMEQYLQPNAPPCTEEDLCPELQYHIRVLILLANCNLGPKLHAIYPVGDILAAILDHSTIFPVKRALGNLMIEVLKSSSDRVEKLESFWQLLDQIALGFETLPSDIVQLSRSPILRIQRGEWVEICAGIIISFFQYFDLLGFNETRADKTGRGIGDAKAIIDRLHTAVRTLIESHAGKLGSAITEELMYASSILNHHLDPENLEVEGTAADLNETKLKLARMQHQRTSVVFADVQQIFLRKQFKHFLRQIRDASLGSRNDVVDFFKSIPWTDETVQSDVRFEPLLKKLTSHFRSLIKRTPLSRSIHESAVDTCKWLLKALRHLFEDALGVSCDHFYDIDVTLVQNSPRLMKLRQVYNDNGVTYLCLDLIAVGMDHGIYIEAMRMLIALMLKSGGCLDIQKSINLYLFETDSILFFELIKDMVESLKSWSGKENEINSQQVVGNNMQGAASSIPEDIIVLNLLQVFCDGAYMNNRDQIRDQVGNSKIVNILESLASYVGILSRSENLSNTYIAIILLKTILRLVQGPCKKNQEQFVLHTELLISLNRMIRSARPALRSISPVWSDYLEDLKEGIVDVLRGVIEGQAKTSLVFDRVATTIDFSVLQVLVFPVDEVDDVIVLDQIMGANKLTKAQAKYLVLTETMNKTVDSLQMQTKSDHLIKSISSVEVQWNNQVQIVYFPVPDFVLDLSIEARNKAIEASQENPSREVKLVEFVKQCKILYRQSLHQQFLKKYGLADLWTVKYYLTRFMFINALVMNALILAFYGTQSHGEESYGGTSHHRMLAGAAAPTSYTETKDHLYIEPDVKLAINILNIVQFVCAIVTVAIFALVQVPVTFSAELEKYGQLVPAIFWTMLDPLPIWYFTYGVFAFLGLEVHPFFLSALLLDWVVLDPTTQDLLLAVQYPARQLVATLVIILICQNIFAGIMFVMYRHDVITVPVKDMWDALKLCISYGFRGEYGIDHEMEPTLGIRMLLDVAFYFIVSFFLSNMNIL